MPNFSPLFASLARAGRIAGDWLGENQTLVVFLVGLTLLNVGLLLVDIRLPFLVTGPLLMLLALAYALLCVFLPPRQPPAETGKSPAGGPRR